MNAHHEKVTARLERLRARAAARRGAFARWLDTFLDEKGIDSEELVEAEGPSGTNIIPVGCLVELMKTAPEHEQRGLKDTMVRIDFVNGDVRRYLTHLAKAVAR